MENQATNNNQTNLKGTPNIMDMYKQAQALIQMANGDPKAAFFSLCQQRGLDPNAVLKQLGLLQ